MPSKTVPLAMLIADKVFREEGTKKVHVAGVFDRINLGSGTSPPFCAYIALTEIGIGVHRGRLLFEYLDEPRMEVFRAEGPVPAPDSPLDTVDLILQFPPFHLPRPGVLQLSFFFDDEYIIGRKVAVALKGSEE